MELLVELIGRVHKNTEKPKIAGEAVTGREK